MKKSSSPPRLFFLAAMATLLSYSPGAQAASTITWTGGGADGNWQTPENWSAALGVGSSLIFAGTTRLFSNNNSPVGQSVAGITFSAGAGPFTLTGNAITLAGNIVNNGTNLETISLDLALNAERFFTTTAGGGDLQVTGVISGGSRLTKTGSGTLELSGVNTYSGTTWVQAGTLTVASLSSLGTGLVHLGNTATGTLRYTGAGETTNLVINLVGSGSGGGATLDSSGSGPLVFNHDFTATGNGNGKTLTLQGNNTENNTISGAVVEKSTSNKTNLAKEGSGTWVLSGANTYTGTTQVKDGLLILDFSAASAPSSNIINSSSTLTLRGGDLQIVGKAGTANVQSFANFFGGGDSTSRGGGTLSVTSGASGGTVALNLGTLTTAAFNNGGLVNFVTDAGTTITAATAPTLAGSTYATRWVWNGADWVAGTGSGPYTLGAFTDYTDLPETGGAIDEHDVLRSGTTLTGNVNIGDLKIAPTASGTLDLGTNALKLNNYGLLFTGDYDYSITNGQITTATSELNIQDFSTHTLTISGTLALGTQGLAKGGTGELVLTANNAYTGPTYINAGVLSISSNANLGSTSSAAIIMAGGTLRATDTFTLQNDATTARPIILYSGGGTIEVTAGSALTVSGVVSNGSNASIGIFQKTGPGVLALTGANTYTGETLVNAGTLLVNGSLNAGSATTVNSGGTLGGSGTLAGPVTIKNGGTVSPGNSISGAIAGTLTAGPTVFAPGGSYKLELGSDGTGAAGTDWDTLAVNGILNLQGLSSSNPFDIKLFTLDASNLPGALGTWDAASNHTWASIVVTTGGFAGAFNSSLFSVDTSGFGNMLGGSFSVVQDGNNLDLIYAAVPEPATYLMLLGGLGVLFGFRRQHRFC